MSQPYIGEIRIFAGNFAPAGWLFCDGQLLPISENDALFTLLGTTFGGDGQETFGLPDLRSRVPIHQSDKSPLGESGGVEQVTLTSQQMPTHNHPLVCAGDSGTQSSPPGNAPGAATAPLIYRAGTPNTALDPAALLPNGGNQPHDNIQPYLALNFIISLFGIFPSPT